MNTIKIIFTKRQWSIVSWLIRWALPRSRFSFALSSHCFIVDGELVYEANLTTGVRCIDMETALKGATIVKTIVYNVTDRLKGIEFIKSQLGKPYDLKGAFGLSLNPDRDWANDNKWFCYELASAALRAAGRDEFENLSHVTEMALLSLKP